MTRFVVALLFAAVGFAEAYAETPDQHDWPTYNHDVLGTRFNAAEKSLSAANAAQLEEKWRFPARDSGEQIGVIHGTPAVVNGYVYFGTATDCAFYKLTPDGKLRWVYRNPAYGAAPAPATGAGSPANTIRFQPTANQILSSALVTDDSVYFGDTGGYLYALDRANGTERWKINTRGKEFPGAHNINMSLASPILADGKIIFAGGALEQLLAGSSFYPSCTGRGFVLACEPRTGKIVWKYDIGPPPERFNPAITITDSWGKHRFYNGPATSTVWSTPSFDAETGTLYFGTDVNTAPRRPTEDNPRLDTPESCAIHAIDVRDGAKKWVTQISPGDVWGNSMRAYDPETGRYKDQSIGDTPKIYTINVEGKSTKVVGAGCKNGGFYVLRADDGKLVANTPIYTGPPIYPLTPALDKRVLALPSPIGGLQTGCATDGARVFTNGIDALQLGTLEKPEASTPPSGGRVVAISADTATEHWRHERPKIPSVGGPAPKPMYKDVGDPVASGIAVANGVLFFTTASSGKLLTLDTSTGAVLKEFDLGPVFCGPSVSRGRIYVGTGNTLFTPSEFEVFFPKMPTGELYSFGLPGEDEISRLGAGAE